MMAVIARLSLVAGVRQSSTANHFLPDRAGKSNRAHLVHNRMNEVFTWLLPQSSAMFSSSINHPELIL
jgi:hypothetical protein